MMADVYRIGFALARYVAIEGRRRGKPPEEVRSLGGWVEDDAGGSGIGRSRTGPGRVLANGELRRGRLRGASVHPPNDRKEAILDVVIEDLTRRCRELTEYIDDHKDEMTAGQYITAIDYQGRMANRIGRLLRDRQQLEGERADELDEAVEEALAIVGEAWDIALIPRAEHADGRLAEARPAGRRARDRNRAGG